MLQQTFWNEKISVQFVSLFNQFLHSSSSLAFWFLTARIHVKKARRIYTANLKEQLKKTRNRHTTDFKKKIHSSPVSNGLKQNSFVVDFGSEISKRFYKIIYLYFRNALANDFKSFAVFVFP